MRTILIFLLLCGFLPAMFGQPVISNKYILTLDKSKTKIMPTKAVDTLVWLGNGYGLIRVVYKDGGYNPRAAKTSELVEGFNFNKDADGNNMAWGIIDTTGKFLLEPIHKSIDLWADMKGLAYEVKYYNNREPLYGYVTFVDLNKGMQKYLKGYDFGIRFSNDLFMMWGEKDKEDCILNASLDTVKIFKDMTTILYGSAGSLKEFSGYQFKTPESLANLRLTPNKPDYMILNNYNWESDTAYNADLVKLLPNEEYPVIRTENGYVLAFRPDKKRVLLGKDLKPVIGEYKEIYFNEDNNCWVMVEDNCRYAFLNPDFSEMEPIQKADLSKKYFDECLALKIAREKAQKKEELGYTNPDLADFMLGTHYNLVLKQGEITVKLNNVANFIRISRLNESQTDVIITIKTETKGLDADLGLGLGQTQYTYSLNGEFKTHLQLDPQNIFIIQIGDDHFGGAFNKVTRELYLYGFDSDGNKIEISAILEK